MLVQRIWTRLDSTLNINTSDSKTLQIWDSGSSRYERLSETEVFWKVIERDITDSGFTETLLELSLHLTPTDFTWKEESPVRIFKTGFEIPGWKIETKIIKR